MVSKRFNSRAISIILAAALCMTLLPTALATDEMLTELTVQTFSKSDLIGSEINFMQEDFTARATKGATLEGIIITSLPDSAAGTLMLRERSLLPGEAVMTTALGDMRFVPQCDNEIKTSFTFIPVFDVGDSYSNVTVAINLMTRENAAPIAQNIEFNAYSGIAVYGSFVATDPEGDKLTYKIISMPSIGIVSIIDKTKFCYIPDKDKTGNDEFTYTATDAQGNISKPARVRIKVEQAKTTIRYADMENEPGHYEALLLAEKGVFVGEQVGGAYFFMPDRPVTRGEFVAMAVTAVGDLNVKPVSRTGFTDDPDTPAWIRPYAAAALKAGILSGIRLPDDGGRLLNANAPMTRAEGAVIVNNTLRLTNAGLKIEYADDAAIPTWAHQAMVNTQVNGIINAGDDGSLEPTREVTRAEAAAIIASAIELENKLNTPTGMFGWGGFL